MIREIKFRAWDIRNGQMVDDALSLSETRQLVTVNADYFNTPFSFFDGCKWMQFTGLKDDHGVEIYEGDILQARYAPSYELHSYKVEWSEVGAAFTCYRDDSSVKYVRLPLEPSNSMENLKVIGNIYANPELTEKNNGDSK